MIVQKEKTMTKVTTVTEKRDISIDILKIIAMVGIVIGHIRPADNAAWTNSFFTLGNSTRDVSLFILSFLGYLGAFGNCLFIICSAYFLTKRNSKPRLIKVVDMISDNWFISICFLIIAICVGIHPSVSELVRTFLPVSYGMNWFVGCYILYYLTYYYLNVLIDHLSKRELLHVCSFLFILYFVIYFLLPKALLYFNYYIGFICIHFFMAYSGKYMIKKAQNTSWNVKLAVIGISATFCLAIGINCLGLNYPIFKGQISYFSYFNNALFFISSYAIFNIVKNSNWGGYRDKSNIITKISSQSIIIFMLHENLFFRLYFKTAIFQHYLIKYGITWILAFSLSFAITVYVISLLVALIYNFTLSGFIHHCFEKIFGLFVSIVKRFEENLLKMEDE